jgi:type I restriction enzyme S subunit
VQQIEESTLGLNAAIDRARSEISLLRELRTRLIADVVTGKLDVREAAARLPDEPDEPQPAEEAEAPLDAEESQAGDVDAMPEEAEA